MIDNSQPINISQAPARAIENEESNPIVEKEPVMTKDLAVKLIVAGIIFIVVLFIYAVIITISKAREKKVLLELLDEKDSKNSAPIATNNDLLYKLADANNKLYNMKFTNEEQQKSLLYKLAKLKKQNKDLIFSKTKAFPSVL
jgi:flagellar biosynthesis/type III secretory pathway M-ring protein FliF/YscJ